VLPPRQVGAGLGRLQHLPARLEELLGNCEVWNYGVGGYGTDQALLRVTREPTGPVDGLLVGLMLENIGRNVNRYRPRWYTAAQPAIKPRFRLGAAGLELVPQPYATRDEFLADVRSGEVLARTDEHEYWNREYAPRWLRWSAIAQLLGARRAYAARDIEPLWTDPAGEPFRTTLAILEAFRGAARGLGTERLVVLVFPSREDLQELLQRGERYWSTLLVALEERGLEFLDLSEALADAARAEGNAAPLYGQSHFSPRGNEVVAEAVRAWLAARWPDGH